MRNLIIGLCMLVSTLNVSGQSAENSVLKLTYVGARNNINHFILVNRKNCEIKTRIVFAGYNGEEVIQAKDTSDIATPLNVLDVKAKLLEGCSSDHGWVEVQACLNLLPVRFVTLVASRVNDGTFISWKVDVENGVAKYSLEASKDGISFTSIYEVSAGNSQYSYVDKSGAKFYRVSETDLNHQKSYSNTIMAQTPSKFQTSVYPNPITNESVLKIESPKSSVIKIQVVNSVGVVMKIYNEVVQSGTSLFYLNMSQLSRGVYQIIVNNDGVSNSIRVVK